MCRLEQIVDVADYLLSTQNEVSPFHFAGTKMGTSIFPGLAEVGHV